jgi:hypothetical protein
LSFELIRMLCVNSYKQRKVAELRLADGHVLILGRNGAGKTTLAQLIPLFYGVPANSMVDRSGGRSPITEFLLNSRASYIVFEYRRHDGADGDDGLRIVVLRSDNEGRMTYQFFRGGYDKRLFITDDNTFRDHADLRSAATSLGLRASEVLFLPEYTAVIQNLRSGTRRADKISGLAADFACVEAGRNLKHIDKIVGSMFKESAGFDDFQRIVISALPLRNDKPTRELQLGKTEIYAWRDQRAAYVDVMRYEPEMARARSEAATLEELSHEIGLARAQAMRLRARVAAAIEVEEAKRSKEDRDHRLDMDDVASRKSQRREELDATRRRLKNARTELEESEAKGHHFERQEVVRCEGEIENDLPVVRARHSHAGERRNALLGAQASIDNSFERLITDRQKAALTEQASVNEQQEQARLRADEDKKPVASGQEVALRQVTASLQAELDPRETKRDELIAERAVQIGRFQNPIASPETVARIEALEAEVETGRGAWSSAQQEVGTAEEQERKAKQAYATSESQVDAIKAEQAASVKAIAELEEAIRPSDESLLAYLRGNVDGWEVTVGKVIAPSLLHRDDLRPTISAEGSTSVLGVELDLARIEADPTLSVEALKAAKVRAEQALDAVEARLKAAKEAQQAAGEALRTAGEAVAVARSKASRLDSTLKQQTEQLKGQKARRALELAECRDKALKARSRIDGALSEFAKETAAIKARYEAESVRIKDEVRGKIRLIDKARDDELTRVDGVLKAIATQEAADIATLRADKVNLLREKGVDPGRLAEADAEVAKYGGEVTRIEKLRGLVGEWKAWKERAANREPELRSQISDLAVDETKQALAYEASLTYEREAIDKHNRIAAAVAAEIERLKEVLRGCDALPILSAHDIPSSLKSFPETENEAALVTVATLEVKAGGLVAGYQQSAQRLRESIGLVRSAMLRAHQSVIRDFYERTEASRSDDPLVWTRELGQWFEFRHHEMLQTLVETAKNTAGQVRDFYNELKTFNREVRRFNDSLQAGLGRRIMKDELGNNRFDKLSDLQIIVSSSLAEEKRWGPLESFIEFLDSQVGRLRDNEVPSDEFVAALMTVLGAWGGESSMKVELSNQVTIRGEVTENNKRKKFASAAEFKAVSSSGLTCIVLMAVLCGFVQMVRGASKAIITWAIDETGRLDAPNIRAMLDVLTANGIRLVTATPELPKRSMQQFDSLVTVTGDQEVWVASVPDAAALTARLKELTASV